MSTDVLKIASPKALELSERFSLISAGIKSPPVAKGTKRLGSGPPAAGLSEHCDRAHRLCAAMTGPKETMLMSAIKADISQQSRGP